MTEYVTLLGSEQVQSAASQMRQAAEKMSQVASSLDYSLNHFLARFDEMMRRMEAALDQPEERPS